MKWLLVINQIHWAVLPSHLGLGWCQSVPRSDLQPCSRLLPNLKELRKRKRKGSSTWYVRQKYCIFDFFLIHVAIFQSIPNLMENLAKSRSEPHLSFASGPQICGTLMNSWRRKRLTHWGRGRTPLGVFQTERSSPAGSPLGSAAAYLTDPLLGQKHTISHTAMQFDYVLLTSSQSHIRSNTQIIGTIELAETLAKRGRREIKHIPSWPPW